MNSRSSGLRPKWMPWLFAAPGLLMLAVFLLVPFAMAFALSFTDQRLIASDQLPTQFVGLRNYGRVWDDDSFWAALRNNLWFATWVVPLQSAFALALALLVHQKLKASKLFRSVFFMPVAVTMAVVAVIWSLLYAPDAGLINRFLQTASGGWLVPRDWLRETNTVLPAILVLSIWQGVGFQMLIFLAGLQSINPDLYEAATLDQANPAQQFFYITLPLLKNTVVFVVITTTIYAFQLYTQVQVIASSGASAPMDSMRTVVMLLVHEGFKNGKIGYASAISVVFFLLVLTISMLQRLLLREGKNA